MASRLPPLIMQFCTHCGDEIPKRPKEPRSRYYQRQFCSVNCSARNTIAQRRDRFWEKVARRGPDDCWIWQAATNRCGYGRLHNELAHRVSWRLHRGTIPEGLGVLHRCDTPACVNPNHLFLGTHLDNMRDALAKGRLVKVVSPRLAGESHPRAKLSQDKIDSIRSLLGTITQAEIARRFGICPSHVSKIASGDRWAHGK